MKITVFLKKDAIINEIFELNQTKKLDLYLNFSENKTIHLSRDELKKFKVGDKLQVDIKTITGIANHFSAHKSGQRHIKFSRKGSPIDIISGSSIAEIDKPIPLATVIASVNPKYHKEPSSNNWQGINLFPETNYALIDLVATPKDLNLNFNMNFEIYNLKKSTETFGKLFVEMDNCLVYMFIRTSTYSLISPQINLIFPQDEGRTFIITRVEEALVNLQVAKMLLPIGWLK